jgi:hypothetical protein
MSLIITAILAILVIFAYSFQIAPIYTGQVFVICLIVIGFISTEHWITHDANEFENRFWTFIAFFFSAVLTFRVAFLTCCLATFLIPLADLVVTLGTLIF